MKSKNIYALSTLIVFLMAGHVSAESLRCKGDIVEIGDTKADVIGKCDNPEMTDSYCEKTFQRVIRSDGSVTFVEGCENVDIWTYNPGKGQFWTNLYFAQGKLREMKYGDRVK